MVSDRIAILSQIKHIGQFMVDMCTRVGAFVWKFATKSTFSKSETFSLLSIETQTRETNGNEIKCDMNDEYAWVEASVCVFVCLCV